MKPIRVSLNDHYWSVRVVDSLGPDHDPWDGVCWHNKRELKLVRDELVVSPWQAMNTLVHEAWHAMHRDDTEKTTLKRGEELADLLWRRGYRRIPELDQCYAGELQGGAVKDGHDPRKH